VSALNTLTEEEGLPLFRQIDRNSVIKFTYLPWTRRRRKNSRKCRRSIVVLPHVSLRLPLVISNVDNDDDGDDATDGTVDEVIT
jgi:hypothetical protein